MKIALTGASGVVGAALLKRLSADGHEVLVLSRNPKGTHSITCDLEHITQETAQGVKEFAPHAMIHAGWAGTENTERNAPHFMQINLDAGMKLIEMAADAGCKRFISFGSQAEYHPHIDTPIAETAPLEPNSNYGITKLALCRKQEAYAQAHRMEFTWLRLFTCYAANYKPTYIIPYLIQCLSAGQMPELKTPHAIWDCLHADDAASAVARILDQPGHGGIYNLSYGKGVSVGEMAMILAGQLGFARKDELALRIRQNETPPTTRVADIGKISAQFGWTPAITIEEGLARCHRA